MTRTRLKFLVINWNDTVRAIGGAHFPAVFGLSGTPPVLRVARVNLESGKKLLPRPAQISHASKNRSRSPCNYYTDQKTAPELRAIIARSEKLLSKDMQFLQTVRERFCVPCKKFLCLESSFAALSIIARASGSAPALRTRITRSKKGAPAIGGDFCMGLWGGPRTHETIGKSHADP